MLVDGRSESLSKLEAALEPLGLNLVRAASGEEARKRLLEDDFALVILDVDTLHGGRALETFRHIRQRHRTRDIPVIFNTRRGADPVRLVRDHHIGVVDYLQKPLTPEVLRSKVSVFVELFRLKRGAEELAYRALHDELTGLPNRTLFMDQLQMSLADERRPGRLGVFFVDLDGFKAINDELGHEAGDQLLVEVAARLGRILRPADTLGRFAGDEFTILGLGLADEHSAVALAERIVATIAATPVVLRGEQVSVTGSVGAALGGGPADSAAALIRQADAAMYRAKKRGKGCCELWPAGLSLAAHAAS